MTDSFSSPGKVAAQKAAYAAAKQMVFESTSVVNYQSTGRVLIIGDDQAVAQFGELPMILRSETLLTNELASRDKISLQGCLGDFTVQAGKRVFKTDLVLDLMPESLLAMALKPPGYFAYINRADNAQQTDSLAIKEQLADMIGSFDKPTYFEYDESICAHARSGNQGCTRCLEACPAEAITSIGDMIKINAYLCQGGGICATVCPSGAIRYAYPKVQDLLKHVRTLILTYIKQGGQAPTLAFVTDDQQQTVRHILPGALIICVEEVASVGPEIWLSALAWGALDVLLFDLDKMPVSSRLALDLHIDMIARIMAAMAYPARTISVISDQSALLSTGKMPLISTATHAVMDQKRQVFYLALDHLVGQAKTIGKQKVKPLVSLPTGAIFGEAMVYADGCTLCMACVSACPGNALQDGGELPQLGFIENNCLQCGVCTATCPEDAISISPRLLLDPAARQKRRVLHEDQPFCCISCGQPFGTRVGVTSIMSKLLGHSMFEDKRALERLKMCSDCRVKDMMEDPETDL